MAWLRKNKPVIQESTADVPATEVKAVETKEKSVEEKYDEIMVVKELPTIQMRFAKLQNGKTAKLVTTEEALTEILNAED